MTPCSPLCVSRRFGGTYRLHLQGRRNVQQRTSKQAGGKYPPKRRLTQRTTRRHIPEDDTLHNHRCENLKFCILHIDCLLAYECFRFSPDDENLVYSASADGTIKLWDLRTGNRSAKEFKGTCLYFIENICVKKRMAYVTCFWVITTIVLPLHLLEVCHIANHFDVCLTFYYLSFCFFRFLLPPALSSHLFLWWKYSYRDLKLIFVVNCYYFLCHVW
jgi:hypothetical protein